MTPELIAFNDGCTDCKNGRLAKDGQGKDYYQGFSFQYEMEQIATAKTEAQCNER